MSLSPSRVAYRYLMSDLSPPLGGSDNPCDLLRRINQGVSDPRSKRKLIQLVEEGKDLNNPQANVVYDLERETGFGKLKFKTIDITPHAQYRMDLRGVSVDEVRRALYAFQKEIQINRSQRGWSRLEEMLNRDVVAYTAPNKLKIVFEPYFGGKGRNLLDQVVGCKIITVYFEGKANPTPPKIESCGL